MKPFLPALLFATLLTPPALAKFRGPAGPNRDDMLYRMQQSAQRLDQQDTGENTQQLQRRIAADLDLLIESLQQHYTGRSPTTAPASTRPGIVHSPASRGMGVSPTIDPQADSAAAGNPSALATTAPLPQPLRELRDPQINLPPRDRNAILNGITHGALPEYKTQIAKYYQALAELNKK
jgi:hypothetical protein